MDKLQKIQWLKEKHRKLHRECEGNPSKELKKEMIDFMLANKGIGLSAKQIGMDAQVFVMGENKDNAIIVINPESVLPL